MKRRKFTIWVVILSLIFWLADSLIHKFMYAEEGFELVPTDGDELWMRAVIIILLIVIGVVGDTLGNRIDAAEKMKREIFLATVSSTQRVLNDLLNQMQLVFLEASKTNKLSDESRKLLEQSITEGKEQIDRLSTVAEIEEKE